MRPPPASGCWPRTRADPDGAADDRPLAARPFEVACPAEHAFRVWTAGIDTWWPRGPHRDRRPRPRSCSSPASAAGSSSGRRTASRSTGAGHGLGAAATLVYQWHLGRDRADATEVEIRSGPRPATRPGSRSNIAAGSGWAPTRQTWRDRNQRRLGRPCCRTIRRRRGRRRRGNDMTRSAAAPRRTRGSSRRRPARRSTRCTATRRPTRRRWSARSARPS